MLSEWGQGRLLPLVAPSTAGDDRLLSWWAEYERLAASPGVAAAFLRIALDVDVRDLLPVISAPTLVLHRTDDVSSPVEHGRYLAAHIPNAHLVEVPGSDHPFFIGDAEAVIEAIKSTSPGVPFLRGATVW